jgi:decaprenylphospho-beta-D-ribofuranose 2-oxidase
MLIPLEHVQTIVDFLEKYVKDNKLVIGLASGKEFDGTQRLLRYSGKGYNLALNLPRTKTSEKSLADLDRLLIACGGRSNLIKDSRISRATAEAFYPEIEEFRETLTEFDSKRLFRSLLSKRIAL